MLAAHQLGLLASDAMKLACRISADLRPYPAILRASCASPTVFAMEKITLLRWILALTPGMAILTGVELLIPDSADLWFDAHPWARWGILLTLGAPYLNLASYVSMFHYRTEAWQNPEARSKG